MDRPNILIVGAGIAGLTLAALLRKRGVSPLVIEKQTQQSFSEAGYMLGLLPLGGRVLNALGAQAGYLQQSCSMEAYHIHDGRGRKLNSYSFAAINERFGAYQGIGRKELITILRESGRDTPIRFQTTVKDVRQDANSVQIIFDDDSVDRFDLVVIADGLHSGTRTQILDETEFAYKQTGWGGWVTWIDPVPGFNHAYHEFWGAGYILGFYPVKDRIGAFLGGPVKTLRKKGRQDFVKQIRHDFEKLTEPVQKSLQSFKELQHPYFWDCHDCKTDCWRKGRVILLGDAATGFLPTAGIGASMAMDAAAALDDEISRADNAHVEYALELFENRQRAKAEKAQKESRDLGAWAFVESPVLAWARNKMIRFYSLERMLKGLEGIMTNQ